MLMSCMHVHTVLLLSFFLLIQCSNYSPKESNNSLDLNINFNEYFQFIANDVLSMDNPDTFQSIKSHIESDRLSVKAHNSIFSRFLETYTEQLKKFPFKETIVEESFVAYLKYVLKRNFDKFPKSASPSEHQVKVIKRFTDTFGSIALNLIQLKKSNLNEILIMEMTKDLKPKSKIMLLKEIIRICDKQTISLQVFLLMLQAFIKTCPETFSEIELIVNLHKTMVCSSNWEKEVFMAPIHFALTRIIPELDGTRLLLNHFARQITFYTAANQQEIVSILNKILNLTNFISKNQILNSEEIEKRREIVNFVVSSIFPERSILEILAYCAQFDEIFVFEAILEYKGDELLLAQTEFINDTLDYIVLCSASRFSDIIYTSTIPISSIKIEESLVHFNLEILLLTVSSSLSPLINHKKIDHVELIPEMNPLALAVVLEIVHQLILIISTFPKINLTLKVPEGQSEFIHLPEPQIIHSTTSSTDLFDRFPIYIYAARIFLYKIFSIPLAATRCLLDSSDESATWSEAVAFINFYIERFSRVAAIENYYKVI